MDITHKGDGVDVVVNAKGRQAEDASVKPQHEEEEDQRGQEPHDAEAPWRISAEARAHVGMSVKESISNCSRCHDELGWTEGKHGRLCRERSGGGGRPPL